MIAKYVILVLSVKSDEGHPLWFADNFQSLAKKKKKNVALAIQSQENEVNPLKLFW